MFEQKEEIQEAIDRVYALTRPLRRGHILSHEMIASVLGVRPHEGSWDYVVGRVRRRLEDERFIATWYVTGVGYNLCTADEQIYIASRRTHKASRQIRRAIRSVGVLPTKGLSTHQCRVKDAAERGLLASRRQLRRSLRDHHAAVRPTPSLPLRTAELLIGKNKKMQEHAASPSS